MVLISCKQISSQSVLADELLDATEDAVLDDTLLAALDEELLLGLALLRHAEAAGCCGECYAV